MRRDDRGWTSAVDHGRSSRAALVTTWGLAVLLLTGACGDGAAKGGNTALPTVTASADKEKRPVLSTAKSAKFGSVVVDARGHILYRYEKDSAKPPRSNCVGPCIKKWPPVLAGDELSTQGIDQSLVGRVRRPDGRWQLTLGGWPLYRYLGDRRTGDLKGQNEDGVWFAIAPDGTKAEPGTAAGGGTGGTGGAATGGTPTKWGPLDDADRELLVKVRQAWLWEMAAAQQAGQRAQSRQVKTAGRQLAAQRADLDDEVRAVAARLRVTLPGRPDAEQRTWMNQLSSAQGKEYDELFVNRVRAAQSKTLAVAAQVRASTRNSMIRAFTERAVDTVMEHMTLLERTGLVDDSTLSAQ
jgi:predicted lipoprotein with Yx(FWY)xxD motif/predicted outer membrane protein